jgi:hypothetical protein
VRTRLNRIVWPFIISSSAASTDATNKPSFKDSAVVYIFESEPGSKDKINIVKCNTDNLTMGNSCALE